MNGVKPSPIFFFPFLFRFPKAYRYPIGGARRGPEQVGIEGKDRLAELCGLDRGEEGPERDEDLGAGAALVADKVADPHGVAVRGDLAVALERGKGGVDRLFRQPGVVGHATARHRQQPEVVGVGAGEQVEVKELFGRAQGFDVRVGPERHADRAVGSHAHTSTDSLLPDSNHHTRRHWNGKGNSWSACAAASSPERMSLKTRRDNGTRPAHLPERDRKTVTDMGYLFRIEGIEKR